GHGTLQVRGRPHARFARALVRNPLHIAARPGAARCGLHRPKGATMNRSTRTAAAVAFAAAAVFPAFAETNALDGRSFDGVFLQRGKTSGDADTLVFRNGRFRSSACDRYGYSDAPYKTAAVGDTTRFE